ncbi:MAG: nitronate monooxygenase, partial [Paracoccus sp. (in: a-proteobacteria)]
MKEAAMPRVPSFGISADRKPVFAPDDILASDRWSDFDKEAIVLEAGGVDAIIAQGLEAGGHRGTFLGDIGSGNIGTFALVPQVADAVKLPVIAAGGVADGRAIAAAFALGASGVQMGTAFLACPEMQMHPLHRELLLKTLGEETQVTRSISGRPARAIVNRYITEMSESGAEPLAFPLQYSV